MSRNGSPGQVTETAVSRHSAPTVASTRWRLVAQVGLGVLAFEAVLIGVHALFFPEYFYSSFLLGRGWVAMLPPYNEHISRDLGALYLGFGVSLAYAALRLGRQVSHATNLGFAVATAPHMIFHSLHTDDAPLLLDKVLQVGLLAFTLVLCGGIWWATRRHFDALDAAAGPGCRHG